MLFLDVEATGTDPAQDCILELALLDAEPDGDGGFIHQRIRVQRYDPGVPIPEKAIAVHGIGPEDLAGAPPFREDAPQVQEIVDGETLCAFNGRTYDTLILDAELQRAGQPGIDLEEVVEIDPYRVWKAVEPRSLEGAVRRYLGREHDGAHAADADTEVLPDLLSAMLQEHDLTLQEAVDLSRPDHEVDRAGRFRLREDGTVVFTFGAHRKEPVEEHPDYLDWMLREDFPGETKETIHRLREAGFRWPPEGSFR